MSSNEEGEEYEGSETRDNDSGEEESDGLVASDGSSEGGGFRRGGPKPLTLEEWLQLGSFDSSDEIVLQDGLLRFLLDADGEHVETLESIRNETAPRESVC